MESLMSHDRPTEPANRNPDFDARHSADIRRLLVRTVAETPRPRSARLSRPAFALAATAALVFAGGVGAGAVRVYDSLAGTVTAQDASAPAPAEPAPSASDLEGMSFSPRNDDRSGDAATAESDTDLPGKADLTPVLTLSNGETGYAYRGDLAAAMLPLTDGEVGDVVDFAAAGVQVPLYSADGDTVLGYLHPASLGR
jgi:hypothetical protein